MTNKVNSPVPKSEKNPQVKQAVNMVKFLNYALKDSIKSQPKK